MEETITDWDRYRLISLELLRGGNPALVPPLNFVPPWVGLLIAPLAILPNWVGYILGGLLMLLVAIVAVKRFNGDIWAILLLCTTPFLLHNILWGNLEWLAVMGMLLPPTWGLVWLSARPQSGCGSVAYYLIQVVRRKEKFRVLIPLIVVCALAFVLYGYPFSIRASLADLETTAAYDIFPWGVPFGIALLVWAVRREDPWLAYAASPLLSPYFTSHTLIGPFLVLVTRSKRWALVAWAAGWILAFATIGRV